MIVYVNNEERELHVYDRSSGVDYAKSVIVPRNGSIRA